jgi:threonine dehydrogenase-like Zn-dependent dehydrogenase
MRPGAGSAPPASRSRSCSERLSSRRPGSDQKLEKARELGAEATVNYAQGNLAERVSEITGGRGVDVVMESVGGDVQELSSSMPINGSIRPASIRRVA